MEKSVSKQTKVFIINMPQIAPFITKPLIFLISAYNTYSQQT